MSPAEVELMRSLAEVHDALGRLETKVDDLRDGLPALEARVILLERFQYKLLGAVAAGGLIGGVLGAVLPLFV